MWIFWAEAPTATKSSQVDVAVYNQDIAMRSVFVE
jgi:hypothetical protein